MAKKQTVKLIHCRYPKCKFLHETTELKKEDAVKGGSKNSYYHPDCWKTLQTVNQIRDTFFKEIDPTLTGKQIGSLVSIVNNMIFSKGIDPELILFALHYFIKYKQGALKYPGGIAYIVQNKDVLKAWDTEKKQKLNAELKKQKEELEKEVNNFDEDILSSNNPFVYKPKELTSFADILK